MKSNDYQDPIPVDPYKTCNDCVWFEHSYVDKYGGGDYPFCHKHEMAVNSLGTCSKFEEYDFESIRPWEIK